MRCNKFSNCNNCYDYQEEGFEVCRYCPESPSNGSRNPSPTGYNDPDAGDNPCDACDGFASIKCLSCHYHSSFIPAPKKDQLKHYQSLAAKYEEANRALTREVKQLDDAITHHLAMVTVAQLETATVKQELATTKQELAQAWKLSIELQDKLDNINALTRPIQPKRSYQ